MNPNSSSEAPIQLPAPVEQGQAGKGGEQAPAVPEATPSGERAAQAASAPMPTNIPLPTMPSLPTQAKPADNSLAASQNPAAASDDTDLIEKEWVTKAKEIVERTRDNPYKQSEELTVFKADYMKKRYNRAIKLK
jgi:hypothetical protein